MVVGVVFLNCQQCNYFHIGVACLQDHKSKEMAKSVFKLSDPWMLVAGLAFCSNYVIKYGFPGFGWFIDCKQCAFSLFECGWGPWAWSGGSIASESSISRFFNFLSPNLYKFLHFASKQLFQCVRMKLRADKISVFKLVLGICLISISFPETLFCVFWIIWNSFLG